MLGFVKFIVFLSPFLYITDRLVYLAFKFHAYTACWYIIKNVAHLKQPVWVVGIYFFFYTIFVLLLSGALYLTYMKFAGVEKEYVFLGRASSYETMVYKKTDPIRKPFKIFAMPPSGGFYFHEFYKPFKVLIDPIDGQVKNKANVEGSGIKTCLIIAFFVFYFAVPCLLGLVFEYGQANKELYPHLVDLKSLEDYLWYFFKQLGVQKRHVIYYVIIFFSIIASIVALIAGAAIYDRFADKRRMQQEHYHPGERVDYSISQKITPGQILTGIVHNYDVKRSTSDPGEIQRFSDEYSFFIKFTDPFDPAIYVSIHKIEGSPEIYTLIELSKNNQPAKFKVTKDLRIEFSP
jgi:hypothetical protein